MCVAQAVKQVKAIQDGKGGKGTAPPAPTVDDVVLVVGQWIGKVVGVGNEEKYGGQLCNEVTIRTLPGGEEQTFKTTDDWKSVADVPALMKFTPTMECTASFRGEKVNGWIQNYNEDNSKFTVQFRPDEAHAKFDRTGMTRGLYPVEDISADEVSPGHSGAPRPPKRSAEQIKGEKELVATFGVKFIYCIHCGQHAEEDPCECYPTFGENKDASHCAACGKKMTKGSCCGTPRAEMQNNQGTLCVLCREWPEGGWTKDFKPILFDYK